MRREEGRKEEGETRKEEVWEEGTVEEGEREKTRREGGMGKGGRKKIMMCMCNPHTQCTDFSHGLDKKCTPTNWDQLHAGKRRASMHGKRHPRYRLSLRDGKYCIISLQYVCMHVSASTIAINYYRPYKLYNFLYAIADLSTHQ